MSLLLPLHPAHVKYSKVFPEQLFSMQPSHYSHSFTGTPSAHSTGHATDANQVQNHAQLSCGCWTNTLPPMVLAVQMGQIFTISPRSRKTVGWPCLVLTLTGSEWMAGGAQTIGFPAMPLPPCGCCGGISTTYIPSPAATAMSAGGANGSQPLLSVAVQKKHMVWINAAYRREFLLACLHYSAKWCGYTSRNTGTHHLTTKGQCQHSCASTAMAKAPW